MKRSIILVTIVTAVLAATIGYIVVNPPPKEQFYQLYILGSERKADNYYPNDQSNVTVGSPVKWFIGVHHLMGETQQILVKVKLGNQSINHPNRTSCTPADLPTLFEYRRTLSDNASHEQEVTWSITDITTNGRAYTLQLLFDGTTFNSPVNAVDGIGFRMIVELWTLKADTETFRFGWTSGTERRCAWTQIWFNATQM